MSEQAAGAAGPAQQGGDGVLRRAFVGLGSNLGDRVARLRGAAAALANVGEVKALSPVYETTPVGGPPQGDYLNAVLELAWRGAPRALLGELLAIERAAGRRRDGAPPNAPRCLDLDLLLCGELSLDEPGLTLPHARLHERAFVLEPLCALAPELVPPGRTESVAELAARVRAPEAVRFYADASLLLE